jgi:hypothetical protein
MENLFFTFWIIACIIIAVIAIAEQWTFEKAINRDGRAVYHFYNLYGC